MNPFIKNRTEMKNTIIKKITLIAMMLLSVGLFAQTPPHPNGGGAPGSGNTPVGGGAPIGGGLGVLFVLGAAYAMKTRNSAIQIKKPTMP
jgi:hypothetical protein